MARRRKTDPRQLSLEDYFEALPPPQKTPGTFDFDTKVRNLLNNAVKQCPHDRIELAARMTRLIYGDCGEGEITKAQIDSWTGSSRTAWRFPLAYLPALIEATGAVWLFPEIGGWLGCKVLVGEQALLAQLGAVILAEKRARQQRMAIEKQVGPEKLEKLIGQVRESNPDA